MQLDLKLTNEKEGERQVTFTVTYESEDEIKSEFIVLNLDKESTLSPAGAQFLVRVLGELIRFLKKNV